MTSWKHIRAVLILPGMATIVIPVAIILGVDQGTIGWSFSHSYHLVFILLGLAFIGLGLLLMVNTVYLLASRGKGTLAPWNPTQKLVVQGIYCYVRNPMISGVFAILLGEAALFGSLPLLYWFLLFFLGNAIYIPLFEERSLVDRFGSDYLIYKQHVPRWIPRLRPWTPVFGEQSRTTRNLES